MHGFFVKLYKEIWIWYSFVGRTSMKKLLLSIFIFVFSMQFCLAKEHVLNFNGSKYTLLYSAKNKDFGGYINEYFKPRETYNTWSEMIAVHHFPNAYSPIDRIKDFKNYLGSMNVPSALTFDDKKNTAMIDFIMIADQHMPIVMEFNIFKYEKSKKCGSIAVQYAKRYSATTSLQIEQIKADFEKNRKRLIKQVQKLNIPEVIDEDIDKCISSVDLKAETDAEIQKEKEAIAAKEAAEREAAEKAAAEKESSEQTAELSEKNADSKNKAVNEIVANSKNDNSLKELSTFDKKVEANEVKKVEKIETKSDEVETEIKPEIVSENVKLEPQKVKEDPQNNEVKPIAAPVPAVNKTIEEPSKEVKKSKKNKKIKEVSYEVSNSKNKYIAEPRTKKELKAEIKQYKLKQKQQLRDAKLKAKIDKKNKDESDKLLKKQAKIDKKNKIKEEKLAKKQAKIDKKNQKKAEKMAKKPYEISNTNNELISKPRTKKDLKAQNKKLKKEAKLRAKRAKKKLSE